VNGRFYDWCVGFSERRGLTERRRALVGDLGGDVLEIGAGTGLNLDHYREASRVVALEPDASMAARLRARAGAAAVPVEVIEARAEELPFPDQSFDHVVTTLVLCSTGDVSAVLGEIRRVLRPAGSFAFLEHVRGEGRLARWQDRLAPLHARLAGGCKPNRDTAAAIEAAGFVLGRLDRTPIPSSEPLTRPAIQGVATRTSS
jgi:ubiquinone/menaquinone biosynthesis C-methylase UbiE